jgi:DNA-binding response OmpR family regulator
MEPSNKKILVIDDDDKIGAFLKLYFSKKGFAVGVVQKAEEAEREIEKTRPDLIFLDYRMSPITGKDILERMKIRGDRTPVVMMSAYRRRDGDMEMVRLGALAYLPKPFDFAEIDRILRRVFP